MKKTKAHISLFIAISALFPYFLPAQNLKVQMEESVKASMLVQQGPSEIRVNTNVRDYNPALNREAWMPEIAFFKIRHSSPDKEAINQIKIEKLNDKNRDMHSLNRSSSENYGIDADPPAVNRGFKANATSQGTPPDNTIAVSNDGIIVSAINSNIMYFDASGNVLYNMSFSNFFNDLELNASIYDPRLIYDSESDRFIFVVLHGNTSDNSIVLVSFSKTNNPLDGWYIYKFKVEDLHTNYYNKWWDYPNIGISDQELFITGNMFTDDRKFYEAAILQINKNKGYSGAALEYLFWNNMPLSPFALVPVSYGHMGNYSPGIYLVSNEHKGGYNIYFFNITESIYNNPVLEYKTIITTSYFLGPDAFQKDNDDLLDIGDCRIKNAFYLNDLIHFVFHSQYVSGYTGINYHRLRVSNLNVQSKVYGLEGFTYAYPEIASAAPNGSGDRSTIIGFLRSGQDIFPEVRAVRTTDNMEFSPSVQVKTGERYVDLMDGKDRWGDYSGIARRHNSAYGEVWMSGCYGARSTYSNSYLSWIAQLSPALLDIENNKIQEPFEFSVYPNPVADKLHIHINVDAFHDLRISIVDMTGKEVRVLFEDRLAQGQLNLSFNKMALSPGVYYMLIYMDDAISATEKIIVTY